MQRIKYDLNASGYTGQVNYTLTINRGDWITTGGWPLVYNGLYYIVSGLDSIIDITEIVSTKLQPFIDYTQPVAGSTLYQTNQSTSNLVYITLVVTQGSNTYTIVNDTPFNWNSIDGVYSGLTSQSYNQNQQLNYPILNLVNQNTFIPTTLSRDNISSSYLRYYDPSGTLQSFTAPPSPYTWSTAYAWTTPAMQRGYITQNLLGSWQQSELLFQTQCIYDQTFYYINKLGGLDFIVCKVILTSNTDRDTREFTWWPDTLKGKERVISQTQRFNSKIILPPITREQNSRIDHLLQSPYCWLLYNGKMTPVLITDSSVEIKQGNRDIIQYTLQVRDTNYTIKNF